MNGHLQLQRRFFSHWLWAGDSRIFSKAEAFLDLLQLAAFTRTRKVVGASLIELEPGQVCGSERYLAGRWGWSTKKVRAFLALLEADHMVGREKKQGVTVITLCNYAKYASGGSAEEAPKKRRRSSEEAARKRIEEGEEGEEGNTPIAPKGAQGGDDQGRILPKGWQRLTLREQKQSRCYRNSPSMIRIGSWFGRRSDNLWTIAEAGTLQRIHPSPEDIEQMARYYEADIPADRDYRRRDLPTLLNNWTGELDRARVFDIENP